MDQPETGRLARINLRAIEHGQQIEVGAEAFDRYVAALEGPVDLTHRRYARDPSPFPAR